MKLMPGLIMNYYGKKPMLYYYLRYMVKRQTAFIRRFILKKSRPWSDDEIINSYKFTNVYKFLDRGTQWLLKNVVHNPHIDTEEELLWNILVYKYFNLVDTADDLDLPLCIRSFDYAEKYAEALEIQSRHSLFTSAHMVCGADFSRGRPWGTGPGSKPKNFFYLIENNRRDIHSLLKIVKSAESMQDLFNKLVKLQGIGKFLAYELVVDINYTPLVDFDENEWANPGPGCINGINWTFSNISEPMRGKDWGPEYKDTVSSGRKTQEYVDIMRWVLENIEELLERFNLKFPYFNEIPFNMQMIEFNFCEFSKYSRALLGCGAPKCKYVSLEKRGAADMDYENDLYLPLTPEQKSDAIKSGRYSSLPPWKSSDFSHLRDFDEVFG